MASEVRQEQVALRMSPVVLQLVLRLTLRVAALCRRKPRCSQVRRMVGHSAPGELVADAEGGPGRGPWRRR